MKKTILCGPMAVGLLFAACQNDDLTVPSQSGNGVAERDQTLYVNVAIRGDVGAKTRAADANGGNPTLEGNDFADGTTEESTVNSCWFVFYGDDNQVVGDPVQVTLGDAVTDVTNTVEKYYTSTVPVSLLKGEQMPTKMICFINPIDGGAAVLRVPLNEVQNTTRKFVQTGNGFAMSNSVYYKSTGNTEPTIAIDVAEENFFDDKTAAEAAVESGTNRLDVYVERYASKLQVNVNNDAENYVTSTTTVGENPQTNAVVLTFVPDNWALNAECKEVYVVKSLRQASAQGAVLNSNFTYDGLNARINNSKVPYNYTAAGEFTPSGLLDATNAWNWNNPAYTRCYWANSPAFFQGVYPEVATDVLADSPQDYLSYNEVTTAARREYGKDYYFKETTVGIPALASKNPEAAMPSVILVGHYEVRVGGATDAVQFGDNEGFYTYTDKDDNGHPKVYFSANANGISSVNGGESMLRRFMKNCRVLYVKGQGADTDYRMLEAANTDDMRTVAGALEVVRPADAVLGGMKVAARYRTLQFKRVAAATGILMATGSGYKTVVETVEDAATQISLAEANKILMQNVGWASFYVGGAAYFNIPVKHYGWYRAGNENKDAKSIDWSKVRVGDFGIVRNHAYNINVTSITGLGTGIGGKDDDIVPPAAEKNYHVAYRVNILKWAVVPQQNVEL